MRSSTRCSRPWFDTSNSVVAAMPENYFELLMRAFLADHAIEPHPIGSAPSYLIDGVALVRYAKERIESEYSVSHHRD